MLTFRLYDLFLREKLTGNDKPMIIRAMASSEQISKTSVPLCVVGASAGALDPLEGLFCSSDLSAYAVVLIQHQTEKGIQTLKKLMLENCGISLNEVKDVTALKKGNCYIAGAEQSLELIGDEVHPVPIKDGHSINPFLNSLKDNYPGRLAIVILSGAGTDGCKGIRALAEKNPLVLVQKDPAFPGMPQCALETGLCQEPLYPQEMGEMLDRYVRTDSENLFSQMEERLAPVAGSIFELIRKQTNHDFSQYKRNTLYRRIERRMTTLDIQNPQDFVKLLKEDSREVILLYRELLIGVTRFFRDQDTFQSMGKVLLPQLVTDADDLGIRIWVPACSTGEEAYSWAILLHRYCKVNRPNLPIQVFGSDTDIQALEKAREGFYSETITDDIPPEILGEYFIPEGKGYRIRPFIRDSIIFAEQNLIQDPPYSRIDMISCRNLLIYLNKDLQEQILMMFHYSLKPEGYLVLGNSETLGSSSYLYDIKDKRNKIYSKLHNKAVQGKRWSMIEGYQYKRKNKEKERRPTMQLDQLTHNILLERYCPTAVLINQNGEILYIQGRAGDYLEFSTGEISNNIIKTAKEGLKIAVANGIRKTRLNHEETLYKGLRIQEKEQINYIDLRVIPVDYKNKGTGFMLVLFHPSLPDRSKDDSEDYKNDRNSSILDLEKELSATQEYLQSTIEELETTNEELKSSNEEAQSTNEELQSANEELETSREELQSVNEELTRTNQELQQKIDELSKANDDISNLLSSTQIATIFLDKEMKIFRFTPSIIQIMTLMESDIGRSISLFTNKIGYPNLAEEARKVLNSLIPKEVEVASEDNRFYWMRILPYRTHRDSIEGLVITFTDITEKKKQDEELSKYRIKLEELVQEKTSELAESEERYRTLYENAPLPFQALDREGNLTDVNPAWLKLLGYSREEVMGKWFGYYLTPSSIDLFREEFPAFRKRGYCSGVSFSLKKKNGEIIHSSFEGSISKGSEDSEEQTYCTFKDITESKAYENELLLKNNALENALNGFCIINDENRFVYVNPAFAKIWGYGDPMELMGRSPVDLMTSKDQWTRLDQQFHQEGRLELNFQGKKKDGTPIYVMLQAVRYIDNLGNHFFLGSNLDITEQVQDKEQLEKSEEKYRLLVENQTDLIVKLNKENRILFVSQSFCRTFGKTEQELLGTDFLLTLHPDDRESSINAMAQLNDPPYTCYTEQRAHTVRGIRWMSWVEKAILDKDGQIKEILGIGRDITGRVDAENSLKESEKRFRALSALTSDYAYSLLLHSDGTVEYEWDYGAFEKITGYKPDQVWSKENLLKIFHPDDRQLMEERMMKNLKGESTSTIYRILSTRGDTLWIKDQSQAEWVEEKNAMRILGNSQDITLQKQYEKRLEDQNRELQHTLEDLNDTQDRLVHQERLAAMGQFSAGIAHDFNNILTGILGTAEILRLDSHLSESEKDHVGTIIHSGERAAQLVRQIMDYSRKTIRKVKDLNLKQTLKDTVKILRSGITEQYKIVVRTSHFDDTAITADQTQIEQLIVNLVMNARDALKGGGEILVELRNRHFRTPEECSLCSNPLFGEYVEILVKDKGIGMDEQTITSIFEPFFTTKEVGKGSGLGLAQVYGIVVQYKGHVQVSSKKGEGSSFSILLPVTK